MTVPINRSPTLKSKGTAAPPPPNSKSIHIKSISGLKIVLRNFLNNFISFRARNDSETEITAQ